MDSFLRLENRHTGETLRMHRERDDSGQVILVIEGSLPPQSDGPPPHKHLQEREEGTVQAGTMGARIGKQTLVVQSGGNAAFPAGVPTNSNSDMSSGVERILKPRGGCLRRLSSEDELRFPRRDGRG